jgi:carboxypeptidase Q
LLTEILHNHQSFEPDAKRYTDIQLDSMSNIKSTEEDTSAIAARRRAFFRGTPPISMINELKKIAKQEGTIALLSMITLSHDGTLFVQGGGSYKITDPENFLDIQIGMEDYMTIVRMLRAGVAVKMEIDVATKFYTDTTRAYKSLLRYRELTRSLKMK